MGITMSRTLYKITSDIVEEFRPFAEKMLSEGKTQHEIERTFRTFLALKARETYKKPSLPPLKSILAKLMSIDRSQASSISEGVLFDLLKSNGVKFIFKKKIGPYTIDYLIGSLVVELDGPYHQLKVERDKKRDAHLKKLGYEIMRIPVKVLAIAPRAVVEAIQERLEALD